MLYILTTITNKSINRSITVIHDRNSQNRDNEYSCGTKESQGRAPNEEKTAWAG